MDTILFVTPGSPYSRVAELALREKGVPHDLAIVPFGDHRVEPHTQRHPFAKVPVLRHGAFQLYETQAILRYVEEAFDGQRLTPVDVQDRARMNQAIGIVDAYFFPSACAVITWQRLIVPRFGGQPDSAAIAAAAPLARHAALVLDQMLEERRWFSGDEIGLDDIMLLPFLDYYRLTDEGVDAAADWRHLNRVATARRPSVVTSASGKGSPGRPRR